MALASANRSMRENRLLRLETLLRLRWYVAIGQVLVVLITHFGLGLKLPLGNIAIVLVLAVAFNVALHTRFPSIHRMEEGAAFLLLAAEIIQLAALLYLTGGIQNPFAILFLAPVVISVTALPPRRTFMLGALAMLCSTLITVFYVPLPWFSGASLALPDFYPVWEWLALQVAIVFIGFYAWRIASEARQLVEALAATELVLQRELHLTQLDGLAAAAAHELGTPLATIALVAKELLHGKVSQGDIRADLALIKEQSDRCRQILAEIPALGSAQFGPMGLTSVSQMVAEVSERYQSERVHILRNAKGVGPEPAMPRSPGVIYGLGNLVQNASEFAKSRVVIDIGWDEENVYITISDDGPGIPENILNHVGEPYLTSRPEIADSADTHPAKTGMGLGLFIAKMLLERSGAEMVASNCEKPETGATIRLSWPRNLFALSSRKREQETSFSLGIKTQVV
jgi:two-component system, sensor histidine kinase RegB